MYIDTINYNQWERNKAELQRLYTKYSKLPAGAAPKVETPEEPPEPICDKFFPLDYSKVFGLNLLKFSLFKTPELIFNEDKTPKMIPVDGFWSAKIEEIDKLIEKTEKDISKLEKKLPEYEEDKGEAEEELKEAEQKYKEATDISDQEDIADDIQEAKEDIAEAEAEIKSINKQIKSKESLVKRI